MAKFAEPAMALVHRDGRTAPQHFAVVFNPEADLSALLAFAHGQVSIAEDLLAAAIKNNDDLFVGALHSVVEVARAAVQQAVVFELRQRRQSQESAGEDTGSVAVKGAHHG